jgi:hypothetical protein
MSSENQNPNIPPLVHGGGDHLSPRRSCEERIQNQGGNIPVLDPNSPNAAWLMQQNQTRSGTAPVQLSNVESPSGNPVHLQGSNVMSTFQFGNPFGQAAPAVIGEQVLLPRTVTFPPSNVSAAPSGPQPEHDRRNAERLGGKNFSEMSAEDLFQVLVGKITTLPRESWIQEDLSGPAFLENVVPSDLGDILERSAKISSTLMRARVTTTLLLLVEQDTSISADLRARWMALKAVQAPAVAAAVSPALSTMMPSVLFPSPTPNVPFTAGAAAANLSLSSPAFFQNRATQRATQSVPTFLSEVASSGDFRMGNSGSFSDQTYGRASVQPNPAAAATQMSHPFGQAFSITINQPSAEPPKFVILESCNDMPQFYSWLRKNRKEFLMSRKVDHKMWNELVSHDVREEIVRIIQVAKNSPLWAAQLFNDEENCPIPREWAEVTEELLLKILFGLHGPRNASAAYERLIARLFFFNDSTTYQDQFTAKIRKFINDFKNMIKDFVYNHHQWPENDILSKEMMRDAFTKVFSSNEMIKGRDGTPVPKCQNLAIVRDIIKQKKHLLLGEIMNHVIDHFERIDIAIRSTKGLSYQIIPWNVQAAKKQKRAFNQINQHAHEGAAARPPRQPALFPRCCNCGSKMHAGTERKCYLWGHPKGKGAEGVWPENGGPSLRLNPQEWKDWKVIRHATFYSYPENAGPRPVKTHKPNA